MTQPNDPLDRLNELWRAVDAPPPDESDDPVTRATVAWLSAAFHAIEPPAPVVPSARHRARRRALRLVGAVAAAASIAGALFVARGALDRPLDGGAPVEIARLGDPPADEPSPSVQFRKDGVELRSGAVRLILLDSFAAPAKPTADRNPK